MDLQTQLQELKTSTQAKLAEMRGITRIACCSFR